MSNIIEENDINIILPIDINKNLVDNKIKYILKNPDKTNQAVINYMQDPQVSSVILQQNISFFEIIKNQTLEDIEQVLIKNTGYIKYINNFSTEVVDLIFKIINDKQEEFYIPDIEVLQLALYDFILNQRKVIYDFSNEEIYFIKPNATLKSSYHNNDLVGYYKSDIFRCYSKISFNNILLKDIKFLDNIKYYKGSHHEYSSTLYCILTGKENIEEYNTIVLNNFYKEYFPHKVINQKSEILEDSKLSESTETPSNEKSEVLFESPKKSLWKRILLRIMNY